MKDDQPVVPATVRLPEITVKAVVLSVILAAVLAAANAYLGLFAGMTVSASIPAAVASMAILRLFRYSNILENNIVQTAASSGEAPAGGVIFTIPALLLVGYWSEFDYWETVLIATVGGVLGVLFTIPLRRALIVTARLCFPEAGADIIIYPAFGSDYPMSQGECLSVANGCRQPWGQLRSTMPAVGGRIGPERLAELSASLGRDMIFVLGSRLQKEPGGIVSAIQAFHRVLAKSFT